MDVDRLRRVEAVLDVVLDSEPARWSAVLAESCGSDSELRREVEGILRRLDTARRLYLGPPGAVANALIEETRRSAAGVDHSMGRRVGNYRLVEEIGRGGMSRVFLGERADGEFEQHVAIKLLRPGLDSDLDVERFRSERQILASFNHPHIARLLDGGVTEDGLPYLVLEHVDGLPVDRYCDEHSLKTADRLRVFMTIAGAVDYAHQRGVVHRDLKPSNILVMQDGTVKLLDFGLAKLMGEEGDRRRLTTRVGHRWLTPDYAAPEQFLGHPATVRTDVYQLGGVLYQLLTGHTPFHAEQGLYDLETAVVLREPASMGRAFRGDLDAIVLKALRKSPGDRYESATALADDVGRHLTGHPVRARQQTLGYRTRRFVGRHRRQLAASAVIVSVSVAFVAGTLVYRDRNRAPDDLLNQLLVTSGGLRDLTDTSGALRLIAHGRAEAGRLTTDPRRQARLLEAVGRLQTQLGDERRGFGALQEALIIRRRAGLDAVVASATSRRANLSPLEDGDELHRRVLYTRAGDVFMSNSDGTREIQLTQRPEALHQEPAWADDGSRILVSRLIGGVRGIYIATLDGTGMTQITAPPPAWRDEEPVPLNDHQIVFMRLDPKRVSKVYRVDLDGTGLEPLTPGPKDDDVAPSPAGDVVAYRGGSDIYLLHLSDQRITRLTNTPEFYKAGVSISPDGKQIAFTQILPGVPEQIFVMNIDGTHQRKVSRGLDYDIVPRWSPDGKRLAFTSNRHGVMAIYTMRLDGTDVRTIRRVPGRDAMVWGWMKY